MTRIVFQELTGCARRSTFVVTCLLGLSALGSTAALAQDQAQHLQTIALGTGIHNIRAEVAQTPAERQIGLMHRSSLGSNDGMLFVFEQAAMQCFWMKNTLIPLDIAFVDDDGTVVNLDQMQPQTLDNHCSQQPVRYVLEMNKGWFAKRGVKAGSRLSGAPFGTAR